MNQVLVLKHQVDGYEEIVAVFDNHGENAALLNAEFEKYVYFKNHTFTTVPLWPDIQTFIDCHSSYMAKNIKREQDPEFAEYQRLRAKFKDV